MECLAKAMEINGCGIWGNNITKTNVNRHVIRNGIHVGSKVESGARIFLFDSDRFQPDAINVKRHSILIAYYVQDFLEHMRKEIPVTADSVCQKSTSTVGRASSPFIA